VPSLPCGEALADARPAGPCHGYPNADSWIDEPVAPGVVLLGDAAGHNDPTIGQGLSITLRDVRLVSEVLLGGGDWSVSAFSPYVEERRERMRRLRFAGRLVSALNAEFTEEARSGAARVGGASPPTRPWRCRWSLCGKAPTGLPAHVFGQGRIGTAVGL
jgi:2-polyprenyl-6-methoxyphenol hydroxylase-like FAD-dependent oxidoreductase